MTASLYWTVVLKNKNNTDKEAAITIDLPKNSALSRATLWINGKAQEAAFSSNAQVQNAYDSIVVRHRDPLLVTQLGPNKIKVLAAPVTANGGEMQFRLGITVPAEIGNDGRHFVRMPHITESNLQFDSKQDIHLTSETRLAGLGNTERSGIYTLRANIPNNEMEQVKITLAQSANDTFATRLTHTNPTEYVKVSMRDGELNFERVSQKPSCRFISDEDAAFRVSNLWAHQEIERFASVGKVNDACDLANAYRIVSSVSGATVLEEQYDYDNNGLNRDMSRVIGRSSSSGNDFTTIHGFVPYSAKPSTHQITPVLQGAVNGAMSQLNALGGGADANMAPMLQGATNGTIGPQGSDATVIQGVNTAGTVRVNNLVNLENLLRALGCVMQALGLALWAFLMSEAILNKGLQVPVRLSRVQTFVLAFLGGTAALMTPAAMNALILWLRDTVFF